MRRKHKLQVCREPTDSCCPVISLRASHLIKNILQVCHLPPVGAPPKGSSLYIVAMLPDWVTKDIKGSLKTVITQLFPPEKPLSFWETQRNRFPPLSQLSRA